MNYFLLFGGQSNMEGAGAASFIGQEPAGIPHSGIRYAGRTIDGDIPLGDLRVHPDASHRFGPELQCGLDFYNAGRTSLTIAKGARGGQPMRMFLPTTLGFTGTYFDFMKGAVMRALSAKSGPTTCYFVWNQGEAETIEATETNALLWATNYNILHGIVEGWFGQTVPKIICRTSIGYHAIIGDAQWMGTVRGLQEDTADHLIDTDDFTFQADDSHYLPALNNTLGSRISGVLLAL